MSFFENINLEILVIWYFFIVGIIGNSLTCFLLYRRIKNFRTPLLNKNESEKLNADCSNIILDKNKIFNRRHNWNLYLYFIGINISDIIVLFSWLISKLEFKVKKYSKITHNLSLINDSLIFDNYELENFINLYSPVSFNYSINTSFNNVVKHLGENLRYISIRLIDIQGVCQMNSYLITVSLQASYVYTVASILDRLLKMKVMNRDYFSTKNSQKRYEIIISNEENKNDKNCKEILNPSSQLMFDIKRYNKSGHSDLIRQYFGKKSVFFIGITIVLFYYHLIWIYMVIENKEIKNIGEFRFKYENSGFNYLNGSIYATSLIGRCQLPTFNVLPVLIQTMDVFLLLTLGLVKLIFGFILLKKYLKKKRSNLKMEKSSYYDLQLNDINNNETNLANLKNDILKNKDKYFLVECIVGTSIFSTLLELPSVLVRNVLMMFFFFTLLFKDHDLIIKDDISSNSYISNSTQNYLNTLNFTSSKHNYSSNLSYNLELSRKEPIYKILPQILNSWCEYFDYLLLFTSSHKFIIYLFKCYFLSLPKFSLTSEK